MDNSNTESANAGRVNLSGDRRMRFKDLTSAVREAAQRDLRTEPRGLNEALDAVRRLTEKYGK